MGYEATIINLGGCGVGRISQDEANEAVELALKYGVNMIDVAPTYGEVELRLAPWVQKMRAHFFIATLSSDELDPESDFYRGFELDGNTGF